MSSISRFLHQSILSYKSLYGFLDPKIYILVKIVTPIMQLIFFVLLASYVNDSQDLTPWVLGNCFILSMYNSLFGVGAVLVSERSFGTLSLLMISPTNNFLILIGRAFIHIFDATITVAIGLIAGYLLFDLNFENTNFPLLILCIVIAMFSAMGIGLFISSAGLITSDVNLVLNTSVFVLMIFTGALFPLNNLPTALSGIPYFLPLTRGIEASKMIVNGNFSNQVIDLLAKELLIGLIYMILGYLLLRYTDKKSREKATLDIY
ncbi:ABC transporter permease [Lysinibacillus sphaericus]|uniref:Transport permease protein n=1 Tax=Lysinibacillus sphaericus TaxID=1421 RepID=A0A544UIH7_LYSSH|nr:ABC transporter permease [Lysinibacillus sp. SDF0037]TQR32829.1 ABC transporter permease [Lysinibacillus sp. SDF0037]